MTRLSNDVHENVRRFHQEEAVWQCYRDKRTKRRQFRLRSRLAEKLFDHFDWIAAEREMRRADCVGKEMP